MIINDKITLSRNEEGKKWFEIIATLTVAMLGFNSAMLYCWASPYMVKILEDDNYNINEEEASYFTVFNQLGIVLLPPFIAPLANRFGRKKANLLTSIPYGTSWLIKAFSTNLIWLYFSRICAGFGDAIVFSCAMAFIGEITTPKIRGIWGNALMLNGFFGQFLINVLGIYCSIKTTSFIGISLLTFNLVLFSLMPESPYYYVAMGDDENAKRSLMKLRQKQNVDDELKEIQVAVYNQSTGVGSWTELVTDRLKRKTLLVGIFLRMCQCFSGIYAFASYTLLVFKKSSTDISPDMATIIYTAGNFLCYTSAVYFSNKLGRRKSLITSMILTGIVLSLEASYFIVDKFFPDVDLSSIQWFPLAGMMGYLLTSSFGVGLLPSLMTGEIFPVSSKSKSISITISIFGVMCFIINNLFNALNVYTGLAGPFLMFGIGNIIFAFISYYIVPETKDKTLEEVQAQLRKM